MKAGVDARAVAAAVHLAQSATAVDVAIDGGARGRLVLGSYAERDVDIARHDGLGAVAAAVDVGSVVGIEAYLAAVDVHFDVAAHGAVDVATAVDAALGHAAIHIDGALASDVGRRGLVAEAAAVDAALEGAGIDIDGGSGADGAQRAAAIGAAVDGSTLRGTALTERDSHSARHVCVRAVAAAMDIGRNGRRAHLATDNLDVDIIGHCSIDVTAAEDTAFHKAAIHIDVRVTSANVASTTEDTALRNLFVASAIRDNSLSGANMTAQHEHVCCLPRRKSTHGAAAINTAFHVCFICQHDV